MKTLRLLRWRSCEGHRIGAYLGSIRFLIRVGWSPSAFQSLWGGDFDISEPSDGVWELLIAGESIANGEAIKQLKATAEIEAWKLVGDRFRELYGGEIDWRPTETIPEDTYAF